MSPDHRAEVLAAADRMLAEERFGARVTVVAGEPLGLDAAIDLERGVVAGRLPPGIGDDVVSDATALVGREQAGTVAYGETEVFIDPLVPRARLVIFGAVHIAQALCTHARLLGFHVTVSDSRPAFTTAARFPEADELVVGWPDKLADRLVLDARTYVVVLSHDARFEDPLWPLVLPAPVRYLGAMGSRRTAEHRRRRLLEAGYEPAAVDRIHGPVGMDIGAEEVGEVAVAILAEMIEARRRPGDPPRLVGELRPLGHRP